MIVFAPHHYYSPLLALKFRIFYDTYSLLASRRLLAFRARAGHALPRFICVLIHVFAIFPNLTLTSFDMLRVPRPVHSEFP